MPSTSPELQPMESSSADKPAQHVQASSNGILNRLGGARRVVAGSLAVLTMGGGAAAAVESGVIGMSGDAMEYIADAGVTVTPSVSSSGTEALIAGNDALRAIGPGVLFGGLAACVALAGLRRRHERTNATFTYLSATKEKGMAYKLLPATIISSVAVASGLGDTAGNGANEPVRILASAAAGSTALNQQNPLVVTQHERVIPFNHSEVKKQSVTTLDYALRQTAAGNNTVSTSVTPFIAELGDVYDPTKENNPSSAPIIALPAGTIAGSMDVDLRNTKSGCSDSSVIVGRQLGATRGDTVFVEGMPMNVAGTVDVAPGLDRVAVIGSLEQLHGCIFDDDTYSGAMVIGVDNKEQLQDQMKELGIHYSVRDYDEFTEAYTDFWDRSVKPVEMQLILLVLGTGIAGVAYMRSSNILRRRKEIATMIANGVGTRELSKAENIRSLHTGVKGAGYAVVPAIALTAITNSSQFGLEQPADIRSLGAGFAAFTVVSMASSINAKRAIKKIDPAQELRS